MGGLDNGTFSFPSAFRADFQQSTAGFRAWTEQVCRRLDWLEKPDRLLLEMIFEQGLSVRKTAAIFQQNPSTVARRVRSILQGLFSSEYQICLRFQAELTPLQMNIARRYFVQKKSRRAIAQDCRLSRYALQRHLERLNSLIRRGSAFSSPRTSTLGQGA